MLVYLCDRCHAAMSPEEARKAGEGGGTLLCARCREASREAARPSPDPSISCENCQVAVSQSLTFLSRPPDAISLPSGEKATANTQSLWAFKVIKSCQQSL